MQPFSCPICDQLLFFHNSQCLRCASILGYVPADQLLTAISIDEEGIWTRDDAVAGSFRLCAHRERSQCNWLVPVDDPLELCRSCRLTTVRPSDDETEAMVAFADAESAKRRLVCQLDTLKLPLIDRVADPERGVAFEMLSSRHRNVMTGHSGGVITLDLSESDDAHREFVRQQLGEPYRTVLGHLRHEIGHYYWPMLVVDRRHLTEFRKLFGDERQSYEDALANHYSDGGETPRGAGRTDFAATHVSQYATMHPWEDWAETFAHYLHIEDGLGTAAAFGVEVGDPSLSAGRDAGSSTRHLEVSPMVRSWLALTLALNGMSRSIGQDDHYPFVLSAKVVEKLDFVHRLVTKAPRKRKKPAAK